MKTANDLFVLGRTEPVVHHFMALYERKEISMEQALIGMVFTLKDQKDEVTNNYTKHLESCTTPSIRL